MIMVNQLHSKFKYFGTEFMDAMYSCTTLEHLQIFFGHSIVYAEYEHLLMKSILQQCVPWGGHNLSYA